MESRDTTQQPCPSCQQQTNYYELECNAPFTAPAPLALKALTVWGAYDADKEIIHQYGDLVHFRLGDEQRLVKMIPFDLEDWQRRQDTILHSREKCEQEGCGDDGYPCFTLFEPDKPTWFYCERHMHENGVCPGCHQFLSGIESFDFSQNEYCDACNDAMDDGYEREYEEDDGPDIDEDWP